MTSDAALEALNAHFRAMPPVAAMQVRAAAVDADTLHLHAPLAANVNDKGCAFGGSLSGVMTLAAWGLVMDRLARAGQAGEVYVADSQVRYLAPLYADLHARAQLAPGQDWADFLRTFAERGRARASLVAEIRGPDGKVVCELTGRFAAFRPAP